jgi:formylglycine-generating enzyme required for sulfatase activity
VTDGLITRIDALAVLSPDERLSALASLGDEVAAAIREGRLDAARLGRLRAVLVEVVDADVGSGAERLPVGVLLGRIGDPRLKLPSEDDYWVELTQQNGDRLAVGKFEVTNHEFTMFVDAGGYEAAEHWTEEGLAWLATCSDPWPVIARGAETDRFLVPNQPVVGVTLHEAMAYASWAGARLARWYERVWAVRGAARRPYPWGSPFGEGNTNSKEEVLQRPCAVGLYARDRTPEGVFDLAGNVGEWTAEKIGEEYLLHPGSWEQPSLATWAKALTTEKADARWTGLGLRLFKDLA